MLKFAGRAERGHTGEGRRWSRDTFGVGVPTVDQVDEFLAPMAADTVLQILHGQGIYWGPRVDKTYAETHRAGRGPLCATHAQGGPMATSMETGKIDYYAIMENAVRDAAKRHGMPVNEFSATVWEGIRETIAKTGELYGTAHKAEAIPKVRGGFGDIVGPMIEQKAKAWGISVKEFKKRLGKGDAELLTAILSTPAGLAAYRQWEQEALPKNSDRRPQ